MDKKSDCLQCNFSATMCEIHSNSSKAFFKLLFMNNLCQSEKKSFATINLLLFLFLQQNFSAHIKEEDNLEMPQFLSITQEQVKPVPNEKKIT